MDDAIVLIDVGFLSKVLARLGYNKPGKFINYFYFSNNLAKRQNLHRKTIFYYCAPPPYSVGNPTGRQKAAKANFDKFVTSMSKYKDFIIRQGRLQRLNIADASGVQHEKYVQKGVDTWLTMDLLEEPQRQSVKNVILVASDSDFVPVVQRVTERDVRVILCHFTSYGKMDGFKQDIIVSHHLVDACGPGNSFEITKDILDASLFKETSPRQ